MEQRLFRLAPESIVIVTQHEPGGWKLTFSVRRGDEPWRDAFKAQYTRLTTTELIDVVCAELDGTFTRQ